MTGLFLKLLNMCFSASWLVLAVLPLRLIFRKAPKWISCLLWSIVALRLLIPFSFESIFSLIPSGEVIPQNIMTTQTPAIYSGISAVNSAVNPLFTQQLAPETHTLERILFFASSVWLAGAVALLLYSAISCWKLHRQVRASIQFGSNLYACDDVQSPFIFGVLFPKIYIPSGIDKEHLKHVLAHEDAHIQRRDHWWKPFGFLLLTVYWFNPLLWLAYILLCRDIEQACDEKVVANMDNAGKKGYSEALVACSVHRRMIMACPVAFGEVAIQTRIKGILYYKKPSFWLILSAALVCAVTAVCFLTNPIPCAHTYSSKITTSSTCTQKGIQTLTCRLCDHSYTARAQLLAHDFRQGDVLTEPDCTHPGSRELVCSGCGKTKTEKIEETGHNLGIPFLSKQPNCTETGEMSAQCTLCHEVLAVDTVATNHDHDLHESVVVAATCANPGEGILACSRCDYSESLAYERLPHNYVLTHTEKGSCIRFGIHYMVCTNCESTHSVSFSTANEHEWVTRWNGTVQCLYCGSIQSWGQDAWGPYGYKDYSLLTDPFASQTNGQPLYPVIKWDTAAP